MSTLHFLALFTNSAVFDFTTLQGNINMLVYQIHLCSIFSPSFFSMHLEQNISLSAVPSLADKTFLLVISLNRFECSDCPQPIVFALVCFQSGICVGCISLFFTVPSALHSREQPKLMFFSCSFVASLNGVLSDFMKS